MRNLKLVTKTTQAQALPTLFDKTIEESLEIIGIIIKVETTTETKDEITEIETQTDNNNPEKPEKGLYYI